MVATHMHGLRIGFLFGMLVQAITPAGYFGGSYILTALLISVPVSITAGFWARQSWLRSLKRADQVFSAPLHALQVVILFLTAASQEADFTAAAKRLLASSHRQGQNGQQHVDAAMLTIDKALVQFPTSSSLRTLRAMILIAAVERRSLSREEGCRQSDSQFAPLLAISKDLHLAYMHLSPFMVGNRAAVVGLSNALNEFVKVYWSAPAAGDDRSPTHGASDKNNIWRLSDDTSLSAASENGVWGLLAEARMAERRALAAADRALALAAENQVYLAGIFAASIQRASSVRSASKLYEDAIRAAPTSVPAQLQYAGFIEANCGMCNEATLIRLKCQQSDNKDVSVSIEPRPPQQLSANSWAQASSAPAWKPAPSTAPAAQAACLLAIQFARDGSVIGVDIADASQQLAFLVGSSPGGLRGQSFAHLFVPSLRSALTAHILRELNAEINVDSAKSTVHGEFSAVGVEKDLSRGVFGCWHEWLLWSAKGGYFTPASMQVSWAQSDLSITDSSSMQPLLRVQFAPEEEAAHAGVFVVATDNEPQANAAGKGRDAFSAQNNIAEIKHNNSAVDAHSLLVLATNKAAKAAQHSVAPDFSTSRIPTVTAGFTSADIAVNAQLRLHLVDFLGGGAAGGAVQLDGKARVGLGSTHAAAAGHHTGTRGMDFRWIYSAFTSGSNGSEAWGALAVVRVGLPVSAPSRTTCIKDTSQDSGDLWREKPHHILTYTADRHTTPVASLQHGSAAQKMLQLQPSHLSASTPSNTAPSTYNIHRLEDHRDSLDFDKAGDAPIATSNSVSLSLRSDVVFAAPPSAGPQALTLSQGMSNIRQGTASQTVRLSDDSAACAMRQAPPQNPAGGHPQRPAQGDPAVSQHDADKAILAMQCFSLALKAGEQRKFLPLALRASRSRRRASHRVRVCHVYISLAELWTIPPLYFLTHLFIILFISQPLQQDLLSACHSVDLSSRRHSSTASVLATGLILQQEATCVQGCSSQSDIGGEFALLAQTLQGIEPDLRARDVVLLHYLRDSTVADGTSLEQPSFPPSNFSIALEQFYEDAKATRHRSDAQRWVPLPSGVGPPASRTGVSRYGLAELNSLLVLNINGISLFNQSAMLSSEFASVVEPVVLRRVFVPAMLAGARARVELVKFLTSDAADSVNSVLIFIVSVPILLWLCIMLLNAALVHRDAYDAGIALSGVPPELLHNALATVKKRLREVSRPVQELGGLLHSHMRLSGGESEGGFAATDLDSSWARSASAVSAASSHAIELDDAPSPRDPSDSYLFNPVQGAPARTQPGFSAAHFRKPQLQGQQSTSTGGAGVFSAIAPGKVLKRGRVFVEFLTMMLVLPGMTILVVSMFPFTELSSGNTFVFEQSGRLVWLSEIEQFSEDQFHTVAEQFYGNRTSGPLISDTSAIVSSINSQLSTRMNLLLSGVDASSSPVDIDISPIPDASDAAHLLISNACTPEHSLFLGLVPGQPCDQFLNGVATQGGIRRLLLRQSSLMEELLAQLYAWDASSGSGRAASQVAILNTFTQVLHLQRTILRPAMLALRRVLVQEAEKAVTSAAEGMVRAWIGAVGFAALLYMAIIPYLHYNGYRISAARALLLQVLLTDTTFLLGGQIQGQEPRESFKRLMQNTAQRAM